MLAFASLPSQALTLTEAYQAAIKNDLTYAKAAAVLDQTFATANQSYANVLPNVSLSYTWGLSRDLSQPKTANAILGGQVTTSNVAVSLSQNLFNLPAFYNLSLANKQKQQAQINYVIAQQDLIQRVIVGYTGLLKAKEALKLAKDQEEYNRKVNDSAKVRYKHGLISSVDYMTTESTWAQSQAQTIQAKTKLNAAIKNFKLIVGDSTDLSTLQDIEDSDKDFTIPYTALSLSNETVANNLSLKALAMTKDIAKQGVSISLAAVFPTINLQVKLANNSSNTTQIGEKGWTSAHKLDRLQAGVSITLPIFTGGKVYNGIKSSESQYTQAQIAYELAFKQTSAALATNLATLDASKRVIHSLTIGRNAAEKAYKSRLAAYESGYSSITDVISASNNFYNVNNNLSIARYDFINTVVQQKILEGRLSENDLDLLSKLFNKTIKLDDSK